MGITLNQLDQFAGGAVEGYTGSQENRRANEQNKRDQRESNQQQEQYDLEMQSRTQQAMEAAIKARAEVDAAIEPIVEAQPGGAIPDTGVTGTPPIQPQQGQQGAALPTPGGSSNIQAPAPPAPGAQAASEPKEHQRRERYNAYLARVRPGIMMAGGMEALKVFDDNENALSRKQMSGYGMAGVNYMKSGNAGEAVKQFNTMLEVSPQDLGMKFEAYDGKVYLVGSDGKRGKPHDQGQMMELLNGKLLDPEKYLAMQEEARKQTEVERAAPIKEGQVDTQLGISQQNAESTTLQAETYADEKDSRVRLRNADSYYKYAMGYDKITGGGSGEEGPSDWWGKRNSADIEGIGADAKNGELGFGVGPWIQESARDSELMGAVVGATKDIMYNNNPDLPNHINDNDAADIARMAYFNDLKVDDVSNHIPEELANTRVYFDDVTGAYKIDYKGKIGILVPPHVGSRIQQNKQYLEAQVGVIN